MQISTQQSRQEMNSVIPARKRRKAILCLMTLLLWAANPACKSNLPKPPLPTAHTVGSNADSGPGSLREAIDKANEGPGPSVINFNLPKDSLRIRLGEPLPPLRDAVTINGFNKQGGRVELDGSGIGRQADGLTIMGSGNTIQGLVIYSFKGHGILISGRLSGNRAVKNQVVDNFIGIDASGASGPGNDKDGVFVDLNSSDSLIARNRIAYNKCNGVNLPDNEASKGKCFDLPADKKFPPPVRIAIVENNIYANGGIPIDLGNDGPTENGSHRGDPDGPNNWQITPEVVQVEYKKPPQRKAANSFLASGATAMELTGTLAGMTGCSSYTIHFFFCGRCPHFCDTCQQPRGETAVSCHDVYIGSCSGTTDANGNGSCTFSYQSNSQAGFVRAWVVCPGNGASELYRCKTVTGK